jgi:hypothetical protein
MDDLHLRFLKTLASLSRKSDTAAIRYAVSRWRALGRYLDGDLPTPGAPFQHNPRLQLSPQGLCSKVRGSEEYVGAGYHPLRREHCVEQPKIVGLA